MPLSTLEKPTNIWETREEVKDQENGMRLQDVLRRVDTKNPVILGLRQIVEKRLELYPERGERMVVLEVLCDKLFGASLDEVKKQASDVLRPYSTNGDFRRTLVISSASSASASWEAEDSMEKKVDIPGAIEGRDIRCLGDGNVALVNTKAGLEMAKYGKQLKILDLANETIFTQGDGRGVKGSDIYYKSDSLLLLMLTNSESEIIAGLSEELRSNPVVHPYNLDEETQMTLLWLARKNKIERLDVNANSPEVGVELTRKGYRYPTVEKANELVDCGNIYDMQRKEWEFSQAAKEINFHPDCMPGYVLTRLDDKEDFAKKVRLGCELMSRRYGLDKLWVKPDRGTDGGNQFAIST
ncbi:hypothetical protein KJ855_04800, partial [Patescibacteria group bacterium]|nr:hypothetical protein [Patescibacteria group bacterium]